MMVAQLQTKSKILTGKTFSLVSAGLLQRKCACGSHTMGRGECEECSKKKNMLQCKLTIGSSNDSLEREADRVASQVMSIPLNSKVNPMPPRIQRFSGQISEGVSTAPPSIDRVLASSGRSLEPSLRQDMETRFGHDFSQVWVHTGNAAEQSAKDVNAHAYTIGNNIVFGAGRYAPEIHEGRRLIAHELTHVVQQLGTAKQAMIQRASIYNGNILYEGDCQHLACNSRWACQDPDGITCPTGTRNAGTKRRPLFTCDRTCESNQTCSDSGNWMAIPRSRFEYRKCGQDLVICANGRKTHASVRDRSEGEAWEVSPGIQNALSVRNSFQGTIYPDENDQHYKRDSTCGNN